MWNRLETIKSYFANAFAVVPEVREGAEKLNAISKGILDLLRNAVVVGGLRLLAEKSQSELMTLIATIGMCALFAYCISYTRFAFRPFHALKNQKLAATMDEVFDRVLFLSISIVVVLAVSTAVQQL